MRSPTVFAKRITCSLARPNEAYGGIPSLSTSVGVGCSWSVASPGGVGRQNYIRSCRPRVGVMKSAQDGSADNGAT